MPEPILVAIAAALATKSATGLYDLVKHKFTKDPAATSALEAAAAAPGNVQPVKALAERLQQAEMTDEKFADALRREYHKLPKAGAFHNQVVGTVHGKVVQTGDVHGNINL